MGVILEILYTLQIMIERLDSQKLILLTQLFWGIVAILYTDYEYHFYDIFFFFSLENFFLIFFKSYKIIITIND